MSKTITASCVGGIVTADGVPVPAAEVLSEGVGASEGLLVVDEEKAFYVAKTTPDLETTLTHLITALTQVKAALDQTVTGLQKTGTTFTATFAGMLGPATAPPPTGPTGVADIVAAAAQVTAAATQIETAKTALNTLKGMLR